MLHLKDIGQKIGETLDQQNQQLEQAVAEVERIDVNVAKANKKIEKIETPWFSKMSMVMTGVACALAIVLLL